MVTGTVEAGAVAVGTRVTIERAGRPSLAAEIAASGDLSFTAARLTRDSFS